MAGRRPVLRADILVAMRKFLECAAFVAAGARIVHERVERVAARRRRRTGGIGIGHRVVARAAVRGQRVRAGNTHLPIIRCGRPHFSLGRRISRRSARAGRRASACRHGGTSRLSPQGVAVSQGGRGGRRILRVRGARSILCARLAGARRSARRGGHPGARGAERRDGLCLWSVAVNGVSLSLWKGQIMLDYQVCQSAAAFFSKRRKKGSLRAIGDGTCRRGELGRPRKVLPHLWCTRGIGLAGHAPTRSCTARAPAATPMELGAGAS